jgi:subfamily B ATP-binding cassette protein MsbA
VKIRIIRDLLRPYPWALPTLCVMGLIASLAEGIGISMLIPFLQLILEDAPLSVGGPVVGWLQQAADWGATALFGTILVLITAKAIVMFGYTVLGEWLNGRVAHDLRMRLFRQLLDVEYGYLLRQPAGRMVDTLQEQTWRAGEAVGRLSEMIVAGATMAVFASLLLMTSWQVTIGLGSAVLLAMLPLWGLSKWARRLGIATVDESKTLAARTVAALESMRVIRVFGQEDREWSRFESASEAERQAYFKMDAMFAAVPPLMEVLFVPLLLGTLLIGWQAGIGLPVLITSLALFYRLQPMVQRFQASRIQLASQLAAVEDVYELLREEDKPYLQAATRPFERLADSIRFEHVHYHYLDRGDPALQDISFEISRGSMISIVGGSGAGKSTLVHLLCRLSDPRKGRILVDGEALSEIDPVAWRSRIALAGQDTGLIDGTIAENIRYGRSDATQPEIEAAARRAEAADFIEALPEAYETPLLSGGSTLSAGQRQRIGLARALVREPCVLILDEASSFLDNQTAAAIHRTVMKLRGEITLLTIAHRLEGVLDADEIVVLAEGRIVERGKAGALLDMNGAFARLYALERNLD